METLLIVGGAALLLLGPKDVPFFARQAGYFSGRTMQYFFQARARFQKLADEAELTDLHQEVSQSMQQLQHVREELRTGFNPFTVGGYQPGPLARQAMGLQQEAMTSPGASDSATTFRESPYAV
ncbi:hypothetical protein CYMTET_18804 [Cymbomonas tetramitiformis]|uniref:Uncharacterized protein n=1 Tax=Cymbomonas tetramitiformis TaxID=36881 RepID=A0AAE0G8N2_9CHLO|nr:hypothetical protein CYMTET_18804 [Cymbomonas tetramitiformis]